LVARLEGELASSVVRGERLVFLFFLLLLVSEFWVKLNDRWHNHLCPGVKKEAWTAEEQQLVVDLHKQMGNKWAEIAKHLPGR